MYEYVHMQICVCVYVHTHIHIHLHITYSYTKQTKINEVEHFGERCLKRKINMHFSQKFPKYAKG